MKRIIIPTKNEEWCIERALSCASTWADYIIVCDQTSQDQTIKIASTFDKVKIISNPTEGFNEVVMQQLLLDEAIKISCDR